jgi:hypothetical protein
VRNAAARELRGKPRTCIEPKSSKYNRPSMANVPGPQPDVQFCRSCKSALSQYSTKPNEIKKGTSERTGASRQPRTRTNV